MVGVAAPCRMRLAIPLAILLASAARAEPARVSLTAGTGVGRDFAGGQLEIGAGNWSGSVGLGLLLVAGTSIALGARWSMRPDGSGFGVGLQAFVVTEQGTDFDDYRETFTVVSATAHWRWLFLRHFIVDVGAGPAISVDSYRFPTRDYGADNGKLRRTTCFGIGMDVGTCGGIPLDIELGLGFAF